MDATAYVVELLDVGDRFFEPLDAEPDEDEEELYSGLDYDEPLEDWRAV
jgi:hypothetical protein